jgi:hypothetical protein
MRNKWQFNLGLQNMWNWLACQRVNFLWLLFSVVPSKMYQNCILLFLCNILFDDDTVLSFLWLSMTWYVSIVQLDITKNQLPFLFIIEIKQNPTNLFNYFIHKSYKNTNNFQQIVVRIAVNLILTTNDITESIQWGNEFLFKIAIIYASL